MINVNAVKDIRAFFGTSGSGKSHAIKGTIGKDSRVIVFDPESEYRSIGCKGYDSAQAFVKAVATAGKGKYRISFEANGVKAFDIFCRTVMAAANAKFPITVVVDELAGVTSVNKAPPAWHTLLTRGRKYGVKIRAGAQSPTEIDKTLLRQRSHLWAGHMTRRDDWVYMAKETNLDINIFEQLRPNPWFDSVMHMHGKTPVINKRKKPV